MGGHRRSDARVYRCQIDGEQLLVLEIDLAAARSRAADVLTAAEHEVTAMVVDGASNAEVAARRGTSLRTVANQLASTYRKLGIASRQELVTALSRHRVDR